MACQHGRLEGRRRCPDADLLDDISIDDLACHFRGPEGLEGPTPGDRRLTVSQKATEAVGAKDPEKKRKTDRLLFTVFGADDLGGFRLRWSPIHRLRALSMLTVCALRCPASNKSIRPRAGELARPLSSVSDQLRTALLTALEEFGDGTSNFFASTNHRAMVPSALWALDASPGRLETSSRLLSAPFSQGHHSDTKSEQVLALGKPGQIAPPEALPSRPSEGARRLRRDR